MGEVSELKVAQLWESVPGVVSVPVTCFYISSTSVRRTIKGHMDFLSDQRCLVLHFCSEKWSYFPLQAVQT